MNNLEIMRVNNESLEISKSEYEELVRDSEKLRCIETLLMNPDIPVFRDVLLSICGYIQKGEEGVRLSL